MHRLKRVVASVPRLSLNLLGDEQELFSGYLNGFKCSAVADSGSDIMVVSGAYAKAHGLNVRRGRRHRRKVEFIDRSGTLTDGFIKGLSWQFREGEAPIQCDFHVIDNLPVDVILNSTFIDEFNIFSEYDDLFIQMEPEEDGSGIYNIRLAEKCRSDIANLEDSFVQDMTSDTPFSLEIIERERARRDAIRDRIAGLLEHERQGQLEREMMRKARFDEEWAKHRERMARAALRS